MIESTHNTDWKRIESFVNALKASGWKVGQHSSKSRGAAQLTMLPLQKGDMYRQIMNIVNMDNSSGLTRQIVIEAKNRDTAYCTEGLQ